MCRPFTYSGPRKRKSKSLRVVFEMKDWLLLLYKFVITYVIVDHNKNGLAVAQLLRRYCKDFLLFHQPGSVVSLSTMPNRLCKVSFDIGICMIYITGCGRLWSGYGLQRNSTHSGFPLVVHNSHIFERMGRISDLNGIFVKSLGHCYRHWRYKIRSKTACFFLWFFIKAELLQRKALLRCNKLNLV